MQRVSIEITFHAYDGFIELCEESSREYEVLKNGVIFRRTKGNNIEQEVSVLLALSD